MAHVQNYVAVHFKSAEQIVILTTSILGLSLSESKLQMSCSPLVVPLCHSLYISIISRIHICLSKSAISTMVLKKDSLHGAENKALLLGQLYVDPKSLWAPFVKVIVQLMYCLVLCCVVALLVFI